VPTRPPPGPGEKSTQDNPGEPADHALGRSQGGFGTKVHLVCDGDGHGLGVVVTPGQRHESVVFEAVMDTVEVRRKSGHSRRRPLRLAGDKAYSNRRIRRWLARRKVQAVIARPDDQRARLSERAEGSFDRERYRQRNVVERLIGWLKECRRVATRYEKLAVNFLAMLKLALIVRYLN
jgi:transposase